MSDASQARCAVDDADVLGPLDGAGLERAVPHQPGQGPDRAVDRLRPADADRLRPRLAEWARGEVGKVGVPVAHLGHMRTLLDGIPPGEMNTSMTINATAAWLLALYVANAEEQGVAVEPRCAARRRTTSSRSTCRGARTSSRPSRRGG